MEYFWGEFFYFFSEKTNLCRRLLPPTDEPTASLAEQAAEC